MRGQIQMPYTYLYMCGMHSAAAALQRLVKIYICKRLLNSNNDFATCMYMNIVGNELNFSPMQHAMLFNKTLLRR